MKFFYTQFLSAPIYKTALIGLFCLIGLSPTITAQNCDTPDADFVNVNQVTDSTAVVNWTDVTGADGYIVEYSPAGFLPGTGVMDTVTLSGATIEGLNACVNYDAYIYTICGDDTSEPAGPFPFMTTSSETCTYTFELFDSFGDGWNGASITVLHAGQEFVYTIDYNAATQATFELNAFSSVPICITYAPGFFENEVSFNIVDPNGVIIYQDGPFPTTGEIATFLACDATCAAPKEWIMNDVNATNATTSWSFLEGDGGDVILEYGPMGFQLGTGDQVTVPMDENAFTITGLEEKTWYNVYLQVDCGADSSKVIGPLVFETLWLVDVGVTAIIPNADDFCNLGNNETITVGLTNFGQLPQTLFEFFFSVNGVAASIPIPQDGLFTGVVGNDSTQLIEFETTWDFSEPGLYVIEAWTAHEDDSDIDNDTFRVEFLNSFPNPVQEDFEDLDMPADWTTDLGFPFYAAFSHGNPTAVFGGNVWSGNPDYTLTTGRIGPVSNGDTLSFDYRYTDWSLGTVGSTLALDSLIVQISSDCEETYEDVLVIDSSNHVTSADFANRFILLDAYDGLTIHVRFLAKWNSGDYWLDLDNINIGGTCPGSFGSIVDIEGSFDMDATGTASILPIAGTGPYVFSWSTGDVTEGNIGLLEDLEQGSYFVDIEDENGCTETITFEVGTLVATDELYGVEAISLYPNPTSGLVNMDIELSQAMDIQTRVMDMSGKIITAADFDQAFQLQSQFDLSNQPAGLYILQVIADGKPYYAKIMVSK